MYNTPLGAILRRTSYIFYYVIIAVIVTIIVTITSSRFTIYTRIQDLYSLTVVLIMRSKGGRTQADVYFIVSVIVYIEARILVCFESFSKHSFNCLTFLYNFIFLLYLCTLVYRKRRLDTFSF
jgi:hypothetical protein